VRSARAGDRRRSGETAVHRGHRPLVPAGSAARQRAFNAVRHERRLGLFDADGTLTATVACHRLDGMYLTDPAGPADRHVDGLGADQCCEANADEQIATLVEALWHGTAVWRGQELALRSALGWEVVVRAET
jgi:hypothetical protein